MSNSSESFNLSVVLPKKGAAGIVLYTRTIYKGIHEQQELDHGIPQFRQLKNERGKVIGKEPILHEFNIMTIDDAVAFARRELVIAGATNLVVLQSSALKG